MSCKYMNACRCMIMCLTCRSGGDQHWQHQDCWQCCAVWDCSHCIRHQVREWPQGERPVAPFTQFNNVNMLWILCLDNKSSPRLCDRFWLWTSWEGFSWTTTGTFGWCCFLPCVSFYLSPVFPAFLPFLSGSCSHLHPTRQASNSLQAGREASQQAVFSLSSLIAFPWRYKSQTKKVTVCLLLPLLFFIRECWFWLC